MLYVLIKQVDILIYKNQALQIIIIIRCNDTVVNSNDTVVNSNKHKNLTISEPCSK